MMPPSPVLRCSPGREHRAQSTHKRGRSLESGLPLKTQDDDLALFKDMRNSEHDSFLLRTADDFEDSIAKLRYFSDYKLGINIPVRGESSDLLNADGDKNDYDWLLTPPDTPLFPSLDDDEPQTINLAPRGRPRSQPVAIPRSSMAEKINTTSRSSASPRRLSPSPRSSSSVIQSRGRPSPPPQSSPPTVQHSASPSRRPSTPPSKPSTPTPRSTTPTLRRMSPNSSGQASSSGRRGASPIKTSRGNSSSPKLRGWQSNLPGFSSDVPPNLRTSLSDRPASYTRGSSPASRNGRDSSKFGRQSISPTASRSASSSLSQERDRLSSYSRGSAASSGDDDIDSLHSATVGTSISPVARKNGLLVNNRPMAFSKKPSRTPFASSAPKRSFDSALRQMDHQKSPQNMFRPLLSSVPSTTFYSGKASTTHRPLFSRNSSLTTSSNASSEQGASFVPDTEGIDGDQNDLAAEWEKPQGLETQEEMFVFDKVDENIESEAFGGCLSNKVDSEGLGKSGGNFGETISIGTASETSCAVGSNLEVDIYVMSICSSCGSRFRISDVDEASDVCKDCAEKNVLIAIEESGATQLVTQNDVLQSEIATGIDRLSEQQLQVGVAELAERSCIPDLLGQHERDLEQSSYCLPESFSPQPMIYETNQILADQQPNTQQEAGFDKSNDDSKVQQLQNTSHPGLRVDNAEGMGISVLLQRSGSSKWPVVQGRVFSATSILCSEPSYTRDNTSAMKRSISRDGGSVSSSSDLGSSRQSEPRVQRQSCRRCETENVRSNYYEKAQSCELHSVVPLSASETLVVDSKEGENFDGSDEGLGCGISQDLAVVSKDHEGSLEDPELCAMPSSYSRQEAVADRVQVLHASDCMATNTIDSPLSSHKESNDLIDDSAADVANRGCKSSVKSEKGAQNGEEKLHDKEVTVNITDSSEADAMSNGAACPNDLSNAVIDHSSVLNLERQTDHDGSQGSHTDSTTSLDPSNMPDSHECSIPTLLEMEASSPAFETGISDRAGGVYEESTVKVEGRHMSRSLTLAEATDTILFCSSIIHDLAYKAATIGMEKELVPLEPLHPAVTKSVSDHQDSRSMYHKRTPKSQKSKKKRLEANSNVSAPVSGGNAIVQEYKPADSEAPSKADSLKPPKLESKCNCTVM